MECTFLVFYVLGGGGLKFLKKIQIFFILFQHQQSTSSSSGGSPKFECSLCTKSFNSRSLLNRHLKNHIVVSNSSPQSSSSASNSPHGNDLKCEQGNCNGRIFASQISLVKHIKTMHAEQDCDKKLSEKRFQCGQCHKRFPTSKDLKRHDVVHTGNREFQCSFCSHRFGRKDHRMRHEKKTHANELLANELSPISLKDQEQKRPIQRWRHVSSPSITPTQGNFMLDFFLVYLRKKLGHPETFLECLLLENRRWKSFEFSRFFAT